jgi:hypothetical protein
MKSASMVLMDQLLSPDYWWDWAKLGPVRRLYRYHVRQRARRRIAVWHQTVLETFVRDVFRPDVPFVLDAAFSWLFDRRTELSTPRRLDLFLPEVPLAIDILGPEYAETWPDAEEYVEREEWEALQAAQARRRQIMKHHRCPYLEVRHGELVNVSSLKERISILSESRYA